MSLAERAETRKSKITLNSVRLNSNMNNPYTEHLSASDSWELLARISKNSFFLCTGKIAPDFVDKTIVKVFQRKKCI
jgi:hypothetical protein